MLMTKTKLLLKRRSTSRRVESPKIKRKRDLLLTNKLLSSNSKKKKVEKCSKTASEITELNSKMLRVN